MRKTRAVLEDHFSDLFLNYYRENYDIDASEVPGIVDKPDLAINSKGRVIGVELSQFPSHYIIKHFHKSRPAPRYTKGRIEGHRTIFPFEPHRWVDEVMEKKQKKVDFHRKRIRADEMWLVMHCHSKTRGWPMSKASMDGTRTVEDLLMRFGTRRYRNRFDRILYIYADGTAIDLTGREEQVPLEASLPADAGYPAVTHHQFSFSCDVPLPGLGTHTYYFNDVSFSDHIVPPKDDWMNNREPHIVRPIYTASAEVDSRTMSWEILADGKRIMNQRMDTVKLVGKTIYAHFLHEKEIEFTTLTCRMDSRNGVFVNGRWKEVSSA